MGDYFKPWRRRLGVVTLVMALVALAGWVRSVLGFNQFCFSSGRNTLEYLQNGNPDGQGVFYWSHFRGESESESSLSQKTFVGWNRFPRMEDLHCKPIAIYPFLGGSPAFIYCGFSFSSVTSKHATGFMVCISYWSIVIPLTAFSAFLLLSKPRKSTQNKTTEPILEKVE